MRTIRVAVVLGLIMGLVVLVGALQVSATPGFVNFASRPQTAADAVAVGVKVGSVSGVTSTTNSFKLAIDLEGGQNTGAFEFDLDYGSEVITATASTAIVTATGAVTGTALTAGAGGYRREGIVLGWIWPNTKTIAFGEATCGVPGCTVAGTSIPSPLPTPIPGMNGVGTLATVSFTALARGVVTMTLKNVQVTDINAITQTVTVTPAQIGVFPTALLSGTSALNPKYNAIAIPVAMSTITNASSLATHIGPGVKQVLTWNATTQQFQSFTPPRGGSNFTVALGGFYFALLDNTARPNALFVNQVPTPPVRFTGLVRSSPCKYNFITIPLDRTQIMKASDLATSIGGVTQVLRWVASTQNWMSCTPPRGGTNFDVRVGDPVVVCLNTSVSTTTWP